MEPLMHKIKEFSLSVDANFDSTYPTNMLVYNTGDISWIPPGIFKISCKIDIRWFPFDEQRCFFKVNNSVKNILASTFHLFFLS